MRTGKAMGNGGWGWKMEIERWGRAVDGGYHTGQGQGGGGDTAGSSCGLGKEGRGLGKEVLGSGWGWRLGIGCGVEDGPEDEILAVSGYWAIGWTVASAGM